MAILSNAEILSMRKRLPLWEKGYQLWDFFWLLIIKFYNYEKEVVNQASMQEQPKVKKETQKKKMGRPTKENVTPTQKNKILNYVIAGLTKSLLKKEEII